MRHSKPSCNDCPICGQRNSPAGGGHHCSERKLTNIERGRLTEIARLERGYRIAPSVGSLIELGAMIEELEETRGGDPYDDFVCDFGITISEMV